jgi:hypothetical protein
MNVIIEIRNIDYDEESNEGYVEALIEDYTNVEENIPEEGYEVNLFGANFSLDEDETIPTDPDERCLFFEELNLNWSLVTP